MELKTNYTNLHIKELVSGYEVWGTNMETGNIEMLIKYPHKSSACTYISRVKERQKHPIHSNRLREYLRSHNMNRTQLSMITGIPPGILSTYISNDKQPSYGRLVYIADKLGLEVEELINF